MRKKQEKDSVFLAITNIKKIILKLSVRNHKDLHLIKSIWQKAF